MRSLTVYGDLTHVNILALPCTSGNTQKETCTDGSKVVTANCVNSSWVTTGDTCTTCVSGAARKKTCSDGSEIVTHTCESGVWKATTNVCEGGGGFDISLILIASISLIFVGLVLSRR